MRARLQFTHLLASAVVAVGASLTVQGGVGAAGLPAVTEYERIAAIPQPNGSGSRPGFGQDLAMSADGSTMLVGAPWQTDAATTKVGAGAAFIYHRDAAGAFQLTKALAAPRPFLSGDFGNAVALSADGSVALVSQLAYAGTTLPAPWSGRYYQGGIAWVFRASSGWNSPELLAPAPSDVPSSYCDGCAVSAALSRDGLHAAVSRPYNVVGKTGVDSYDYDPSSSTWIPGQRLAIVEAGYQMSQPSLALATDGTNDFLFAGFGWRQDLTTNTPAEDVVYVLTRATGTLAWSTDPAQTIVQPGGVKDTRFGKVLSANADGHVLLVGAEAAPSPGPAGTTGAAYVFGYVGTSFALRSTLHATDSVATTHFGLDVALNGTGTTALVARHNEHAAYVFHVAAAGWPNGAVSESARLDYSDTASNDLYGAPIGVSDDLAGSRSPVIATGNGVSLQSDWQGGAVYVYGPIGTVNDSYTTAQDVSLTVNAPGVVGNDYTGAAGEVLTAEVASPPGHGSLTLNGDGSFAYTPQAGYSGMDIFTYYAVSAAFGRANEATVAITVSPAPPPSITSLLPGRVLETRPGEVTMDGQLQGIGRRAAGSVTELVVAGRAGVPVDASAVMLNVTAVNPDAAGFLTVFPCGTSRPNASNVNYLSGQVVPNAVMAKIGQGGMVCIFTLASTDLVVDVNAFA